MNSVSPIPAGASQESYFCTLFDSVYLTRGIALYQSLRRSGSPIRLTVLCLDAKAHQTLDRLALPGIELVTLEELEVREPRLRDARLARKAVEFYFTCKPVLMMLVAEKHPVARRITYLDSDLYYFSDPADFEQRHGRNSVALTPHRFPPELEGRNRYGRYNAGWVSASCDAEGKRFVEWWRELCLDWCSLDVEEDRFGDQKYLDRVQGLFSNVESIDSPGANLAPWNIRDARLESRGAAVMVNGEPIWFFHFHGLRRMAGAVYDTGLLDYGVALREEVRLHVFRPYLAELGRAQRLADGVGQARLGKRPEYSPDNPKRRCKHMLNLLLSNTWMLAP